MTITDDGIGIADAALRKAGSLGIIGMQERLRAAGGDMRIVRVTPHGTAVTAFLSPAPVQK